MAGKFSLIGELMNDASKSAAAGEDAGQPTARKKDAEYIRISVYDLVPSKDNFYSQTDIDKLKTAIELAGKVYQNLVAVPLGGGKYKVIAGHRRRLASITLVEEGKPEFEFVTCAIEETEADAELQEIREELLLIYTNSQREKTAWDKIEEARRVRLLFERMKDQKKIKGSIRALVAKELDISGGQVGRYETITKHLSDDFKEELKFDRINISTAVELAGLSPGDQQTAYEEHQTTGAISIKDAKAKKPSAEPEQPEEPAPPCPAPLQVEPDTPDAPDMPSAPDMPAAAEDQDTTEAELPAEPVMPETPDAPSKPTTPENQNKETVIKELLLIVETLEDNKSGWKFGIREACKKSMAQTCRKAAELLSEKGWI